MINLLIGVAIMAGITYLIRVLPITIFQKKIKSVWIQSFLFYVPYAVLAALTFPAIFYGTGNFTASVVGTIVALILAWFNTGLVIVALGAVVSALIMLIL
ncbi:MAG: AzlD domain-containing protein [Eubacterium sp.]|nr:AzlD domain-containing protein [Eubacterium sp.]